MTDIFVGFDAGQHFLELEAMFGLPSGPAGFDILPHDFQAELFGFTQAGFALGGQTDAFGVIVSV
ncbi:MAG: hypothetical protein FWD74_00620 [Actinomycetia bacterium]|nr:hypothetical protein [Actinomycetes bacterium]